MVHAPFRGFNFQVPNHNCDGTTMYPNEVSFEEKFIWLLQKKNIANLFGAQS